jgi:hypothetical protein
MITPAGRSGLGHGNLHWTANSDEVQDFENDIHELFGEAPASCLTRNSTTRETLWGAVKQD